MKINKKETKHELQFISKTKLTDNTPFDVKEAYKLARTNILFSLPTDGCKYIAVSSSLQSEGKTTTTSNIAISFAQMGKRTLVIDADMRRPRIHNVFDVDNQVGLSNILGGFVKVNEAIKTLEEGLDVITSGHIPPNPTELLSSGGMRNILSELEEQYDYIFIDTPPINIVTDAIVISQYVSGMIIVAKQGVSKHHELKDTLNKLNFAKAKILGVCLTAAKNNISKYSKYSKYGSYRGYEDNE